MKFINIVFAFGLAIIVPAVMPSVQGPENTVWPDATPAGLDGGDAPSLNSLNSLKNPNLTITIPPGIPVICQVPGWEHAAANEYIFQGIDYLRHLKNDPRGGPALCKGEPGPEGRSRCKRVSCSHNSGIFVCDDLDHEVAPTCKEVADAAYDIVYYCDNGDLMQHLTQGQKFGPSGSGWNVIVAGELC